MIKKDWQVGITPEMREEEETREVVDRIRILVEECTTIVDELFPEAEEDRKPAPTSKVQRYYGRERG
jgi:hypothetical protein